MTSWLLAFGSGVVAGGVAVAMWLKERERERVATEVAKQVKAQSDMIDQINRSRLVGLTRWKIDREIRKSAELAEKWRETGGE